MFATGGLMHVKMHKSRCEAAEHFRVFFPGFCSVPETGRLVPGLCVCGGVGNGRVFVTRTGCLECCVFGEGVMVHVMFFDLS